MNELKIINEQEVLGKDFKIYGTVENPLFLAKDVAEWIDYAWKDSKQDHRDVSKMIQTVDEDEKLRGKIFLSGQKRDCWFLTENGLYEVLMLSTKPIAKKFKKQVKEILKTIRKNGIYATDKVIDDILNNPDFGIELLTKVKQERQARIKAEKERNSLQIELDKSKEYYTIKRMEKLNPDKKFNWRLLKSESEKLHKPAKDVFDNNYGTVKAYHVDVWESLYFDTLNFD